MIPCGAVVRAVVSSYVETRLRELGLQRPHLCPRCHVHLVYEMGCPAYGGLVACAVCGCCGERASMHVAVQTVLREGLRGRLRQLLGTVRAATKADISRKIRRKAWKPWTTQRHVRGEA